MRTAAACLLLAAGSAADPPKQEKNSLGMAFVVLPPGEFVMGSSPEYAAAMAKKVTGEWYRDSPPSETPPRKVTLTRGLAVCVHETRLKDFRAFVADTGYRTDAERDGKGADGKRDGKWVDAGREFNWKEMGTERGDDEPVVNVSWNDAVAFCKWLSKKEGARYRLPTEAEWEYACRAGTTGPYPWGDDEAKRDEFVWSGATAGGRPHPVMTRKPNAWGLYDLLGNAYEYCSDGWTMTFDDRPRTDPAGPAKPDADGLIVVRGGSWGTAPVHCRSAFRGSAPKDHRNRRDGFRVVRDPQ
ncbi:MAG: formylglycine-generating enzyme family protein [Gemmataceae bacterium]|nr:formylglycine-generating enzyme family protein [Gemmataceae bacterium]